MKRIKSHPSVVAALKQYEALPDRDQKALQLLGIALAVILIYFLMWAPASAYMNNGQAALERNRDVQALIQVNYATLSSLGKQSSSDGVSLDSQQLVSAITNLAKKQGVALKRFEPSGDNKVKVWLEKVPFDKMIAWLGALDASLNISADQVSIEKEEAQGMISARITLSS
jgi:general secretion pathway protein M